METDERANKSKQNRDEVKEVESHRTGVKKVQRSVQRGREIARNGGRGGGGGRRRAIESKKLKEYMTE